jgi:hypothetical protein
MNHPDETTTRPPYCNVNEIPSYLAAMDFVDKIFASVAQEQAMESRFADRGNPPIATTTPRHCGVAFGIFGAGFLAFGAVGTWLHLLPVVAIAGLFAVNMLMIFGWVTGDRNGYLRALRWSADDSLEQTGLASEQHAAQVEQERSLRDLLVNQERQRHNLLIDQERQRHALQVDGERSRVEEERRRLLAETIPCALQIDLPPAGNGLGYLYVIRFSTGVVKVGQTAHPRRRLFEHRRDAAAYKVNVVRFWISEAHPNFLANETMLINLCAGVSARAKREYFHEVEFDVAVGLASSLATEAVSVGVTR